MPRLSADSAHQTSSEDLPVPKTVTAACRSRPLGRRLLVMALLPALLAACGDSGEQHQDFPPLDFGYLTKLRLNVATIDIDDAFAQRNGAADPGHVEALAPEPPADALEHMAQQRLITAGSGGHARFVIDDASLVTAPGGFAGSMHVHLDITTPDGAKGGSADARVSRTYTASDTSDSGTRAALYDLVKLMMSDMNVEFEYQLKHSLRNYLESDQGTAPLPAPVETQDLNGGPPPPGADQAPPSAPPPPQSEPSPQPPPSAPPTPLVPPAQ
jgi:hypothetical protein